MSSSETAPAVYNLEIEAALAAAGSSHHGLSPEEATKRLKQYGPNQLSTKKTSWLKRILEPFASYFALVIIAAALLSLYEHKWFEAIIISVIIIVNALIYYVQQFSVSRVLKTLQAGDKQILSVVRGGKTLELDANKLVPGDIVHLAEGQKVPADGRLIDVSHLQANESMLTGESLPIHKHAAALTGHKEVYDQKNMVFKGTHIHAGTGVLLVTATGNRTELGTINKLASEADQGKTPIELKIDDLTQKLLIGIGLVSIVVFGLAIMRGIHLDEALRFTLSLIVSAVPEGLPVAMTLVLLLSANRMAKQKALVKKLSAMETMGAITLIVTDKTGTITKNKLSIADTYSPHSQLSKFLHSVAASLNGSAEHSADPLDELLVSASGTNKPGSKWKKIHDFPFDQQQRLSGAVWQEGQTLHLFVKGAPEKILLHASADKSAHQALEQFTSRGQRTIGFARKTISSVPAELNHKSLANMQFEGFVALSDQLRPGIARAITEAHEAGIKVVMLTGDHVQTARYVAEQTGIAASADQVADGELLAANDVSKIRHALTHVTVFGRVLPEHKYALLKSVKGTEITAMTGDGVNDIPALVEADAGLAMGSGADAAKDASDIILVNSNFTTIINAVRTGRTVLANIRKMIVYLLATSGGEVLTMLSALLLNIPLPITAVMVLWVNLVTDGVSVIPLGLSPSEGHHMRQAPSSPNAPLLNKVHLSRAVLLSVTMAATVLLVFKLHLPKGLAYAQTIAFLTLIVIQWANALNMNFDHRSWVYNFIRPNGKLLLAIGGSIVVNIALFCTPLRQYFSLTTLQLHDAAFAVAVACVAVFAVADIHKLLTRNFGRL